MTKYKIASREFLCNGITQHKYFVAQVKYWWSPVWFNIKYFYKSEFEDMPGYWTEAHATTLGAERTIADHKSKRTTFDTLIREI